MNRLENRFAQAIIAFAAILIVAQAATAQVSVVGVDSVRFAWEPALGNPDGYRVSVVWNGAAPTFYQTVSEPEVSIAVVPGDRVRIQVEALRYRPEGGFDIGPASQISGVVIVEGGLLGDADFDTDTNGFAYADDAFRGTGGSGYSEGIHDPEDGYSGGGLRVDLGGVDDNDVFGISGAWSTEIYLSNATLVTIDLRTRITTSGFFETDECIESLIAIDGVLVGSGEEEFLLRACGETPETGVPTDTGWVQRSVTAWLPSGAHTIEIGGHASKKTTAVEFAAVHFDDVSISAVAGTLFTEPATLDFGNALQGSVIPLTRDLEVDASGTGSRTFAVSSNQPWVSATPVWNTTPAVIRVEVDPSALSVGQKTATLTLSGTGVTTATLPVTVNVTKKGVFAASFDVDSQGFTYSDDSFRSTGEPDYAAGSFVSSGGYNGGGLRIDLGGIDSSTVLGMSGGFSRNFFVVVAADYAIRVRTRMVFSGEYEEDECSQILVAVDGVLQGYGSADYREQVCGEVNPLDDPQDTSWYDETIIVPLSAGIHTLTIGGYGNKKTLANESTQIFVDDVVVEHDVPLPEPGLWMGLSSGVALLGMLSRRRRTA